MAAKAGIDGGEHGARLRARRVIGSAAVLPAPALVAGLDEAYGCKRFWFVACSNPPEVARRHDRLKLAEVEFADRAQCFGGRGILQVLRQVLQLGVILGLQLGEFGDGVVPAASTAAMIGRTAGADHRRAGGSSGAIARLAFGVGHGSFTDGIDGHGSTPKRYVTEPHSLAHGLRRGFSAATVVAGLDDVAMMGQAVEQRGRHLGVAKNTPAVAESGQG